MLDRPASLTCSQCLDAAVAYTGTQCTCFTGTKAQILTQGYTYTAPLHIADLQIITECLHSDWDTCDAETYRLEAHFCPPGYTLIGTQFTCFTGKKVQTLTLERYTLTGYDLNPGPSRARACVLYSRRASRLSQVRLVVGPHQTASLCRESAGEGSANGWEQFAVDLMDGFGGDLRLRVCVLKDSVGMLTNLSFRWPHTPAARGRIH